MGEQGEGALARRSPRKEGRNEHAPTSPTVVRCRRTLARSAAPAGSRLHPVYERLDFGDGAELLSFVALKDTQRDELCSEQTLSDGQLHCAPAGERMAFTPDEYFADATCSTTPVIGTYHYLQAENCGSALPPPTHRYFTLPQADSCAPVSLVAFPSTPPLAVTTIYAKSGSSCTAVPVASNAQIAFEIYASPPLPLVSVSPSDFVSLTRTETVSTASSRLRGSTIALAGADGSSWTGAGNVVDSQRNEFCFYQLAADGTYRCMPWAGSVVDMREFSDPACSKPVLDVSDNDGCSGDTLDTFFSYMSKYVSAPGSCGQATQLYPRFSSPALSTAYYGTPTLCTAEDVSHDTGYTRYAAPALPAPIPPSSFSDMSFGYVDSPNYFYAKNGTRIRFESIEYAAMDGFRADFEVLPWDGQVGQACEPVTLADGELHCVPWTYGYFDYDSQRGNLYADAACSEPVFGAGTQLACGSAAPTMYADSPTVVAGCNEYHFFRVPSAPLSNPTLFWRDQNGACTAYTGNVANEVFYRVSDCQEVSPSEFTPVTASLAN